MSTLSAWASNLKIATLREYLTLISPATPIFRSNLCNLNYKFFQKPCIWKRLYQNRLQKPLAGPTDFYAPTKQGHVCCFQQATERAYLYINMIFNLSSRHSPEIKQSEQKGKQTSKPCNLLSRSDPIPEIPKIPTSEIDFSEVSTGGASTAATILQSRLDD